MNDKGDGSHSNKQSKRSGDKNQPASSDKRKGSNHTAKPLEEDANIKSKNKINDPTCPMNDPRQDTNLCKVIQAQVISMKSTWLPYRWLVGAHTNFADSKKCSTNSDDINMLVTLVVFKALNMNKKSKSKDMDNSDL